VTTADLAPRLRAVAGTWEDVLTSGDHGLRRRPVPTVWSPLEYGCHVRDVFRIFVGRLEALRIADDPEFANWDQDRTALDDGYAGQDPGEVAEALVVAGRRVADGFASVGPDEWGRTGRRSDGARFTVDSLGRYLLHDPVHHLVDVGALAPGGLPGS
jgi:hypothetical protein